MRIWYQYPAPISPFRSIVLQHVTNAIDRVRRPETEVVVQPATKGAPKTRLYTLETVNLHTAVEIVERLLAAEGEGFDGAVIGQSLDPGLPAAKELLGIPVVGIMEAAVHFAAFWGEAFGLVTIPTPAGYPPTKYPAVHKRNIARYGLAGKLVAAESLDMDLDQMTADIQAGDHAAILDAFDAAARRCLDQGADVVIAGDTILSVILVAEERLVLPSGQVVVDLITSGIKQIESLVDLHQALGIVRSRAGQLAAPTPEDFTSVVETFALNRPIT